MPINFLESKITNDFLKCVLSSSPRAEDASIYHHTRLRICLNRISKIPLQISPIEDGFPAGTLNKRLTQKNNKIT